jgi:hypothetical protein
MKTSKTAAAMVWMATVAIYGAQRMEAQTLNVGLYDYANLSAKEIGRLTETASLILADSGIQVTWVHCRGPLALTQAAACATEPQANRLVVRLLPDHPRMSSEDAMGHAQVDAEGGSYASVFVSAVRAKAPGFGVASALLMGYVLAHELGHCLLGPHHSETGLMRGGWNRKDAVEISQLSLHLTKQQAQKAVARLGQAELMATR